MIPIAYFYIPAFQVVLYNTGSGGTNIRTDYKCWCIGKVRLGPAEQNNDIINIIDFPFIAVHIIGIFTCYNRACFTWVYQLGKLFEVSLYSLM
jgi:hypothetical protein